MKIDDGKKGLTVRMFPDLLLRIKKIKRIRQLKAERDISLNEIVVEALENECKRENV